jgi:hypothetical protein
MRAFRFERRHCMHGFRADFTNARFGKMSDYENLFLNTRNAGTRPLARWRPAGADDQAAKKA